MAERRRIIPASVGPDFNGSPEQPERPTRRLTVVLPESSDKTSPEFSYADLVKDDGGVIEEEKSFNDLEEDDLTGLAALARKFEEKYGAVKGKKKRKRLEDVVDAGLGYDDNDPFVDNSECYDELVPSVLTTKFGGFYINSGELQFKEISGESSDSDFEVVRKRRKYQKRKKRRSLESDDEKQTEPKKRQFSSSSDAGNPKKKLKKKLQRQLSGKEEKKKKKKKLNIPKAPTTVAELLKTKNVGDGASGDNKNMNGPSTQNGPDGPPSNARTDGVPERIDPSMDIGVPNLPMDNEMAAILSDTLADWGGGDELPDVDMGNLQGGEEGQASEEQEQLPEWVPSRLERDITKIREAARKSVEGKCKFFSPAVNSLLLEIENESRELSCSRRSAIYNHLAFHLPCTKDTLLKRAKKLRLGAQDSQLKEPILRLKEAISEVMPAQIERYQDECTAAEQARQERMDTGDKNDKNASEDEEKSKGPRQLTPRRKFTWTDHLRDLLCQVVSIKVKTYQIAKKRSHSAEDYLKAFLENDIKPLWPQGWMQTRMLFKESRSVHSMITSMPFKHKKLQQFPKKLTSKKTPDGTPSGPSAPGSEENTPSSSKNLSPNISPHSENSLSPSSLLVQGAKEFPTLLDYAEEHAEQTRPMSQSGDRAAELQNSSEKERPSGTLQFLESAVNEVVRKLEKEKNSSDEAGENATAKQTDSELPVKAFAGGLSFGNEVDMPSSNQEQEMGIPVINVNLPDAQSGAKIVKSSINPHNGAATASTASPAVQTSQSPLISPHKSVQVTQQQPKVTHIGVSAANRPLMSSHSGGQAVERPTKSPHSGGQTTQQPQQSSHNSRPIAQQPKKSLGGNVIKLPVRSSNTGGTLAAQPHKAPHGGNITGKMQPAKSLKQLPTSTQQKSQMRVSATSNSKGHKPSAGVTTYRTSSSGSTLSSLSQPLVRLTRQPSIDQMSPSMLPKLTVKTSGASKVTVQRKGPSPKGPSPPSGGAVMRRTSPSSSVVQKSTKVPSPSPMKAPSPSISPSSQGMYPKQRPSPVDRSQPRTSPHSPKIPMPIASPTHYPTATSGVHRVSPVRVSPTISPYPPPHSPSIYGAMQQHHQVARQNPAKSGTASLQRRGSFQGVTSPMTSPTYTEGIHPQSGVRHLQAGARGFQQLNDIARTALPSVAATMPNLVRKAQPNSAIYPGMSVPGLVGRSASLDAPPASGAMQEMVPGMEYMPGHAIDPNYDNNAQGQSRLL